MKRMLLATAIMLLVAVTSATAEWRIDIENKTVWAGQSGITVNFTAYWDIELSGISVPIIVREIDPGAFWAGALPYDTGGNAYYHPHVQGVAWNWAILWASLTEELLPGIPSSPCATDGDLGYDGLSPDHFCINGSGSGLGEPAQPSGMVFITVTFDVGSQSGDFEFDTACFTGSLSTIFMIDNNFPPVDHGPSGTGECSFNKGLISIVKDSDNDGITDDLDNCPLMANPGQENSDTDSLGNACDNCPTTGNPDQANSDADQWGDACDNCVVVNNPTQANSDADEFGDACDNCPGTDNPDQLDTDNDQRGDLCDNCPDEYNPNQSDIDADGFGDVCDDCIDFDHDGYGDPDYPDNVCAVDNCPTVFNPDQADSNGDGRGDACDCECAGYGDLNQDGKINPVDVAFMVTFVFKGGDCLVQIPTCPYPPGDWNCSWSVNPVDVILVVRYVYRLETAPFEPCEPCEDMPAALPDLVLGYSSLKLNPDTIQGGESTTIEVDITNSGYSIAYNAILEIFDGDPSANGTLLWNYTIPYINRYQVVTQSISQVFFTPGTREIYAVVDRQNQIQESSETNNTRHKTLVVTE